MPWQLRRRAVIHNYEEACAFIEAGASALGASAGIAIVEGAPTEERR